LSGYARR